MHCVPGVKVSECFPDCVIISDNSPPPCNDTPSQQPAFLQCNGRPGPGCTVTQNPVTRCHETFALQEFLNKRCHEDFIQIVRREYHYHRLSPSVISNNTTHRAHLTITMSLQCLASVDQSGLSKPLSTNQIARSGPGLHLAAILAALGEAAL